MENILPIGTVVTLKNGSLKVMIIARYPLYNYNNRIGYFDYSGCVFPSGVTDNQTYFFNTVDIEKVWFTGFNNFNGTFDTSGKGLEWTKTIQTGMKKREDSKAEELRRKKSN
ncbi:DUF4176 domain-containing protein [Streptococcus uberis]|uniref:DUF4176 domain-containing protein n=1 Tax=Streptococcus uberis TaxID=1349 RepID=UPI001FF662E1|nr:DUF4176 domain-containing protein [Streptococcus uberis]MCK1192945.1 DUF4176 domain-containing protein [Streptococcus uberis]MCK1210169.1 DUF4176 domain-containing protein [Streptococcus uberis]MCK1222198.1 DUF4176 domain-containing protein [Streptococcus uberis]